MSKEVVIIGDAIAEPQIVATWLAMGRTPTTTESRQFSKETIHMKHKGGQQQIAVSFCDIPDRLTTLQPAPNVVVMCYTPLSPQSHESLTELWSRSIDRIFPRPTVLVIGTRVESLGNRKILEKMKKEKIMPISVDAACDELSRYRAVDYAEISVASNIGLDEVRQAIVSAALGEATRRTTPAIVNDMRAACIQSVASKQSVWVARRDKRDNRLFFFNRMTRKAVWERPADFDGEDPELTKEEQEEEAMRKQMDEEERLRSEKEKQVAQQYMHDLAEYEQRMTEMETRSDKLNGLVNSMKHQLEAIKKTIQTNSTEREKLERLRDSMNVNEVHLAKSTVEEDEKLERELQLARNRAFELEAVSALKMEQDYDLQLSENLIRNKSLATRLRELLQEQLHIQKQGAQVQAKCTVATKAVEEAAKSSSFLSTKVVNTKQQVSIVEAELQPLEEHLAELRNELNHHKGVLADHNYTEIDRHRRQQQLIKLCDECDTRISELNAKTSLATRIDTQDDRKRLNLERRTLTTTLASSAAECAVLERHCTSKQLQLKHLQAERQLLYEKLLESMTQRLETAQRLKQRYFEGPGYSPVTNVAVADTINELNTLQDLFDVGRSDAANAIGSQMATAIFGVSSKDGTPTTQRQLKNASVVSKYLTNKLQNLDEKGQAVVNRARVLGDEIRHLKTEANEDATRAGNAVESFDALLTEVSTVGGGENVAGGSIIAQPLERLKSKAAPALMNDPAEMRALVECFAKNVLKNVNASELNELTVVSGSSSALSSGNVTAAAGSSATSAAGGSGLPSSTTPTSRQKRKVSLLEMTQQEVAARKAAAAAYSRSSTEYDRLATNMSASLRGDDVKGTSSAQKASKAARGKGWRI